MLRGAWLRSLIAPLAMVTLVALAGCGGRQSTGTGQQAMGGAPADSVPLVGQAAGSGGAAVTGSGGAAAPEPAVSGFYAGKTLTLIVPNSPGQTMDTYARTIAPYIQKYAGLQNITVQNLTGAGGIKGTNVLWSSKPDGLTIAFTSIPALLLAQLSGSEGIQFDATKFVYLGRAATDPRVLAVGTKSGINSIQDILRLGRPFVFPSQGTDEDFYTMAILADALKFPVKTVTGFEGNADVSLAVIKGDGDGFVAAQAAMAPLIRQGDVKPILVFSSQRSKEYPDVPSALEVVPAEARDSIQAIINMIEMHRSFFGPPNMDPNATAAMRDAIAKALADPELLSRAERLNLPIVFMHGSEEQERVLQIAQASERLKPVLKAALQALK